MGKKAKFSRNDYSFSLKTLGNRSQELGARSFTLETRNQKLGDQKLEARNQELGRLELEAQNQKLRTRSWNQKLEAWNQKLGDQKLEARDQELGSFELEAQNQKLRTRSLELGAGTGNQGLVQKLEAWNQNLEPEVKGQDSCQDCYIRLISIFLFR